MAPMVVGTALLLGGGGTLGTDPHTLCFLWYTPQGIRSNALGQMPDMVNLLDRMVDLVERLDLVRQVLAGYRIGPRKVVDRPRPCPALASGSNPPPHERHKLCSAAGLFEFRAIQGMQGLRRRLVRLTPDLLPSPL